MPAKKKGAVPKAQGIRYRVRKDGTVRGYEVRYRDPQDPTKVRGKTFRTLEEAKAFQTNNDYSIHRGTYIAPEREATTWKVVSREWLDTRRVKLRNRTVEGYDAVLGRWFGSWDARPIVSLTRADVRSVVNRLRDKGLSEETERKVFSVASAVFKYALQEGYIRVNPTDSVRDDLRSVANKDFKPRPLTLDEAQAIIGHLPEGRYRLFGLLGLWTGFRPGELAGLRVRNLDRLRNVVQVDETVEALRTGLQAGIPKTKKSRGRRVPIPKAVMEEVGAYIDGQLLGPEAYVFADQGEFFVHKMFARRQWKPACRKAGVGAVRFYDLRHTFASLRAQQGVPPHVLKEWMGHTNIQTTMNVYSHVYQEDKTIEALIERMYGSSAEATPVPTLPTASEG